MRRNTVRLRLVLAGGLIALLCRIVAVGSAAEVVPIVPTAPLAERLPADVVMYLGWAGVGAVGPNFAASDLGKVLADPEVARLLPVLGQQLRDNLAYSLSPTNKSALAESVRELLIILRDRPVALVVRENQGRPSVTLVVDLGQQAEARVQLEKIVASLVAQAGEKKPETVQHGPLTYQRGEDAIGPIEWAFVGGRYFAVSRGKFGLPPVLDTLGGAEKAACLRDDKHFRRVMERVRVPETVLVAYQSLPANSDTVDVELPSLNQLVPLHSPAAERRARWEKALMMKEASETKPESKPDEKCSEEKKPEKKKPEDNQPDEKKPDEKPGLPSGNGSAAVDMLGLVSAAASAPGKNSDTMVPESKSDVPERPEKPAAAVAASLVPRSVSRLIGPVPRLGLAVGFAEGNLKTAVWLDGARLARPGALAPERIDAELLALLPPDTEWFAAGGSGQDLVNAIEAVTASPNMFSCTPMLSRADWPKRFRTATGLNWRTDVADHLGRGVIFNSPSLGGRWFGGTVLLIEVRNYAALKKSEAKLVEFFTAKYSEKPAKLPEKDEFFVDRQKLRPTQRGEGPYTVHSLAALPRWDARLTVPSWAITEEFVVIGLYPQAVRGMLRRLSEDQPKTLAERPEFRELLTRQSEGGGGAVLLAGTDSQRLASSLTGLLLYFQTALREELADELPLLDFRSDSIPGLDLVSPRLRPTVGALTPQPDGLLYATVGSLPGVSEFGLTVGLGMVLSLLPNDALTGVFGLPNRNALLRGRGIPDDGDDEEPNELKKAPEKKEGDVNPPGTGVSPVEKK